MYYKGIRPFVDAVEKIFSFWTAQIGTTFRKEPSLLNNLFNKFPRVPEMNYRKEDPKHFFDFWIEAFKNEEWPKIKVEIAKKLFDLDVSQRKGMYEDYAREVLARALLSYEPKPPEVYVREIMPNAAFSHKSKLPTHKFDLHLALEIPHNKDLFNFTALYVATESVFFPYNLLHDINNLVCVLGPNGGAKKASVLYELDPNIGVMRLIPTKNALEDIDPRHQINSIGYAVVIQCYNTKNELCWLVDTVDAGVAAELTQGEWMEVFFQGIKEAATDPELNERPKHLYFNQYVANRNNRLFNEFVRKQGKLYEGEFELEKVGGNQALIDAGIKRAEHYLDAFKYRKDNPKGGSCWTASCKGYVDVVEVEL